MSGGLVWVLNNDKGMSVFLCTLETTSVRLYYLPTKSQYGQFRVIKQFFEVFLRVMWKLWKNTFYIRVRECLSLSSYLLVVEIQLNCPNEFSNRIFQIRFWSKTTKSEVLSFGLERLFRLLCRRKIM